MIIFNMGCLEFSGLLLYNQFLLVNFDSFLALCREILTMADFPLLSKATSTEEIKVVIGWVLSLRPDDQG
jgi:hypothetical protein